VADGGSGLPDGYRAGVGLTSMRERAAGRGGRCDVPVRTTPSTVFAELPVAR
jgi:two-component system, NarL family, sensor kinase